MNFLMALLMTCTTTGLVAQGIPADKVLEINQLSSVLKPEVLARLETGGSVSPAKLAEYFRQKFSERFFYDHKTFSERLVHYNGLYANQADHRTRAVDHQTRGMSALAMLSILLGDFTGTDQW